MGLFRRLFPRGAGDNRTLSAVEYCSGDFHQAIVGEASYQDELRRLAQSRTTAGKHTEFRVLLMPEPANKYDSNAVAVYVEGGGVIGYLARDIAAEYQRIIIAHFDSKRSYPCCMARMYGGTSDKPSLGVWLDIDWDSLEGA